MLRLTKKCKQYSRCNLWFNLPCDGIEETDKVVENVNQTYFPVNTPTNTEKSFIKFLKL